MSQLPSTSVHLRFSKFFGQFNNSEDIFQKSEARLQKHGVSKPYNTTDLDMSKSDVNGVLKSKTGIFRGKITILETSEVRSEVTQALCSERFRENHQILGVVFKSSHLAERVGFERPIRFWRILAFQVGPFSHSVISQTKLVYQILTKNQYLKLVQVH